MQLKLWDFSDTAFLAIFVILTGSIVVLIFLILTFVIINHKSGEYGRKLKQEGITARIYSIDVKHNSVLYFNRSDLRHRSNEDLNSFYYHFHENDREKVKQWIYSICVNGKSADQYLEADVIVNRGHNPNFSLLKLVKYDEKVGVIHLESYLLRYITPSNFSGKKKNSISGVVKRSTMNNVISKSKSIKGFTFAIRFFYVRQKALSNDKIERYMVMTLKNEVYPFASNPKNPRSIIDESANEMFLFDLRIDSRDEAMRFATSIAHSLRKCIGVNGYSDSIHFAIGVCENQQFYQDFDEIVQKAQEACITAQQNQQDVYIYQKSLGPAGNELNKFSADVDRLMQGNSLRYLFRPIIDVSRSRILGYFEYVRAYDSPFANFGEMSKYAAKLGRNRELFALIAKNLIPKFASEKPVENVRLFFRVSMLDIDHMEEILPQVPSVRDISLVLVFDEQEVNENASQLDLLNASLKKFRMMGFEIALSLQDKNLLLDSSVYTNFDFFIAGARMMGEIRKNNRVRLSIHTLIEELLKFDKPIIATDLEGWQAVELIIKSGIHLISSEAVSSSNDMLLPIEKKKMDKLTTMYENFK